MTKIPLALLDPKADDDVIDGFLAALGVKESRAERYSPDQARVPGGNEDGGEWTATGSSGASATGESVADFRDRVSGDGSWPESGEMGGFIDPATGELSGVKEGGRAETEFSTDALGAAKGKILIHSHPGIGDDASGLSDGDLRVAVVWKLGEIRAETETMSTIMRPGPGGWTRGEAGGVVADRATDLWNKSVDEQFARAELGVYPNVSAFISNANKAVAKEMGWEYVEERQQ